MSRNSTRRGKTVRTVTMTTTRRGKTVSLGQTASVRHHLPEHNQPTPKLCEAETIAARTGSTNDEDGCSDNLAQTSTGLLRKVS